MSEWYYAPGGEQLGPVDEGRMRGLVAEGTVTPETLVWSSGMADWEPAHKHFPDLSKPVPPLPPGGGPGGPGPARTFGEAIQVCFEKFANFNGRASRSEFWWWYLFTVIVSLVTILVPVLNLIASLVLLIPNLAVSARRLHDIGRSGWWLAGFYGLMILWVIVFAAEATTFNPTFTGSLVLGLAALAAAIVLLVWFCTPGQPDPNEYDEPGR